MSKIFKRIFEEELETSSAHDELLELLDKVEEACCGDEESEYGHEEGGEGEEGEEYAESKEKQLLDIIRNVADSLDDESISYIKTSLTDAYFPEEGGGDEEEDIFAADQDDEDGDEGGEDLDDDGMEDEGEDDFSFDDLEDMTTDEFTDKDADLGGHGDEDEDEDEGDERHESKEEKGSKLVEKKLGTPGKGKGYTGGDKVKKGNNAIGKGMFKPTTSGGKKPKMVGKTMKK